MDGSLQGQRSTPHRMFNSLPLPSNSRNMDAWTSVHQPSLDLPLPCLQPPRLHSGPAVKRGDTPLSGDPGAKGWRRRMGQETKKERKTEGEQGEWAARAEILRLLASCAKRLVLLAPLWLADLGADARAPKNFYPAHLYGLISHLTSWQVSRASGEQSTGLISVLMWY